ncbi:site-specific integrase [Nocardioides KLBMP 9356]|uniref:Site-specific integrase n=1 Tax=Nocardioides potassii TaxID=2911371 RepID=A0ABS9HA80_9ACTN|nr:site-specific integrase [Nocardioides potassii]MCF6378120.1 site-specific integrase [Nocardioides potassii]
MTYYTTDQQPSSCPTEHTVGDEDQSSPTLAQDHSKEREELVFFPSPEPRDEDVNVLTVERMTPAGAPPVPHLVGHPVDHPADRANRRAAGREGDRGDGPNASRQVVFAGAAPADRVDSFLAEASRRRAAAASGERTTRPTDWVEAEPALVQQLLARRNPVDRALARSKEGLTRDNVRYILRLACARLRGIEDHRSLSYDDVRNYPWHELSVDQAADYRRLVYRLYAKQSTRNDQVCAIRRVVIQCFKAGLISALRRDYLLEELYTIAPGPSSKRRRLTSDEITALLHACETTGTAMAQARNTAMVAVFRTSGMRISELSALDLDDWDREADTLFLAQTKNGKDHLVFLHPDAVPYLERWVRMRGDFEGPLFSPVRIGADPTRHLDTRSIRYMLGTRARKAGIAPFGSHDFRRTFATELLRTHDVALVGKLLNHSKPASTLVYDLSGEEEQREAVGRLELPGLPDPGATPGRHAVGITPEDGAPEVSA